MRRLKRSLLLVTMLCLSCLPACCQSTENSIDALRIHTGWTAPAAGYYLTDAAMRDTIAGWTEARRIADVRAQALEALRDEIKAQQSDLRRQLAALQTEIELERQSWRTRVRRGKVQGIVYGVLLGFGSGYLVRKNNS